MSTVSSSAVTKYGKTQMKVKTAVIGTRGIYVFRNYLPHFCYLFIRLTQLILALF
jgi:hypothetical protein